MWGYGPHDMGWGGWVMMALMMFLWFGVIALIVAALSGTTIGRRSSVEQAGHRGDPAATILRDRFARGDITADEYESARRTLNDDA